MQITDDIAGLLAKLEWCATHRDQLPALGQRSRELVKPFSAEQGALTFVDHVHYCLSATAPSSLPTS